jgi:hypothetical protein
LLFAVLLRLILSACAQEEKLPNAKEPIQPAPAIRLPSPGMTTQYGQIYLCVGLTKEPV